MTGLCECGCGALAPIAQATNRHKGWTRGDPKRFVHGHNARGQRAVRALLVEDRGYETPCHIWPGYRDEKGYGRSAGPVHRMLWEREHGSVPDGYELDHLCRVRECARLDHLEVVTHQENCRRGAVARTAVASDPTGIRALRVAHDWSQPELAAAIGVSNGLISKWECAEHRILPKYWPVLRALGWTPV